MQWQETQSSIPMKNWLFISPIIYIYIYIYIYIVYKMIKFKNTEKCNRITNYDQGVLMNPKLRFFVLY